MNSSKQTSNKQDNAVTKKHTEDALAIFYDSENEDKGLIKRMRLVLENFNDTE